MTPADLSGGVDVIVNAEGADDAPVELIEAAVRRTLAAAAVATAEISVTLLDDPGMRALNRDYLDRDYATDVIAFALGDQGTLGDVYIGLERAREQAETHSIGLEEELVRLAIHGSLHVLGHDHPEGPERAESEMFEVQERLVREVMGPK